MSRSDLAPLPTYPCRECGHPNWSHHPKPRTRNGQYQGDPLVTPNHCDEPDCQCTMPYRNMGV